MRAPGKYTHCEGKTVMYPHSRPFTGCIPRAPKAMRKYLTTSSFTTNTAPSDVDVNRIPIRQGRRRWPDDFKSRPEARAVAALYDCRKASDRKLFGRYTAAKEFGRSSTKSMVDVQQDIKRFSQPEHAYPVVETRKPFLIDGGRLPIADLPATLARLAQSHGELQYSCELLETARPAKSITRAVDRHSNSQPEQAGCQLAYETGSSASSARGGSTALRDHHDSNREGMIRYPAKTTSMIKSSTQNDLALEATGKIASTAGAGVLIDGLMAGVSERDVQFVFSEFGEIVSTSFTSMDWSASRVQMLVIYKNSASAAMAAKSMNGIVADGRPITARFVDTHYFGGRWPIGKR